MKRNIFIFALVIVTFSSCLKDEGNYDYSQLKEVTINGLNDSYRFILQVPQSLTPTISTDIPNSNLSYCWRVGADTLSKEKDFNYTFSRVPVSKDPLTFEVYDKSTNVRYAKTMTLNVVSPFYTGWLILANNKGQAALDFKSYESDSLLYQNLYEQINHEKLTGTPLMVKQINYQDGISGSYADRVAIVCKNGKSPDLDGTSLLNYGYFEDEFKTEGEISMVDLSAEYYSSDKVLNAITEDGKIYGKTPGSLGTPEDGYFEYPYNGDDHNYSVAPFLVRAAYTNYYFTYDELNHRFVYYESTSLSSKVSSLMWNKENSITTTNLDTIPGKAVWMGGVLYDDDVYSIILNKGNYYLYRFSVLWDGTATMLAYAKLPDNVINEDSKFALHPSSPYLFVSNGNKLEAINLENLSDPNSAVNDIATYSGKITAMQFSYNDTKSITEFGIAIQSSADKSSLLIINPQLTTHGAILKHFDNINGTIVSICRKYM